MKGKTNVRTTSKTMIKNHVIEKVYSFNYLGCTTAGTNDGDLRIRMNRFNKKCRTIGILKNKPRKINR
jgi:20S proteasome alpha/beta subunit